jgi:hypothetical protein
LLKKYPEQAVGFIWFTDEKLFTVAAPVNMQNDRVYAPAGSLKRHLSAERLLRTRATFSKSVMISVGVSALGCTELIFVEPGVKINGAYYRDVLLSQHLLPAIKESLQTASHSSKTAHQHTELEKPLNCCQERHQISFLQPFGHQTVQISILWTIKSGVCYKSESTRVGSET